MNMTNIKKNTIKSGGQSYSNYIYTFIIDQLNGESELLPYQIETNQAFNNYLNGQGDKLAKFKNALQLNENYFTIMNLCVSQLAQRNFEELDQLIDKAQYYSQGQTHHMIFLVEFHLLLNDDNGALKQLIDLFINKEESDAVQGLLKELFKKKLYSKANLEIFVQDIDILEQLIKLNIQCFIQYQSYISQNSTLKTLELIENVFKQQLSEAQSIISNQQSFNQEEINNTISQQTFKTEQLSFISEKQDVDFKFNKIEQLDFSFIDIVMNNPNLFSFTFRIPYMIGSYDIKRMSKLQSKIAEGGFGEVYLAKHLITNEIHALKVIKQQEDENVNLILQETIIQDKIQKLNPQLFLNLKPQVYLKKEHLLVDIYIPLELGQFSLYEYILEHQIGQCEYNYFYNLFIDYIVTLHTNKYAHRDIKPQNILYVKDVGWKLADFGESIKYDNALDIYKIKGTFAFLPLDIGQSSKKIQQIKQNLLYNDVYAVVCTLLMIKNPNFSSKELTNHMDKQQLEHQLYLLLENFDNLQLLSEMKISNLVYIQPQLTKQYIYDQEIDWDYYEKLKFYADNNIQLDNDNMQKLDEQLHQNQYLSLIISYHFPFQIDLLKNMKIFNFARHLFAENFSINDKNWAYFIIHYFLVIRHYYIAIKVCDQAFNLQQDLIFYLLKISALISLKQQEWAKEELELMYRYFLSTQSYSLEDLTFFFSLYLTLHNEIPKIKIDEEILKTLIAFHLKLPNKHEFLHDSISPISQKVTYEKQHQHIKLRLDVLFEIVQQDPYIINMNIVVENIKQFGNQFIVDEELQNCEELISLIKENLIFWNRTYCYKIHIIAIGINYLFTYFGKYQIALSIGEYFHNILSNVGSCESIIAHYEHLINTQLYVFQQFPQIQGPFVHIDWDRFFDEVTYLPFVDRIYLHLKSLFIQYQIRKKNIVFQQEEQQQFINTMNQLLDQLLYFAFQKDTTNLLKKQWIQFLLNMIRKFAIDSNQQLVNILKVVKKIVQVVSSINQNYMIFIPHYNIALDKTKQSKINLAVIKQYLTNKVNLSNKERVIFKNLIDIFMSPIKAINILKQFGLNNDYSVLASVKSNFNVDLRLSLFIRQEIRKMKVPSKFLLKVDQINMKQQYLNL